MKKNLSHWCRAAGMIATCCALTLLTACGGGSGGSSSNGGGSNTGGGSSGGGSGSGGGGSVAYADPLVYSSSANASLSSPPDAAAVTHAQLTLNGKALSYTATAGHLSAKTLSTGQPEASFFYVAYTLDNQQAQTRPVTFFYNGGPGSSTVWLHLGSFGPKRIVTNNPATQVPNPLQFVDNQESLLDVSDLVFIDAVGTGWSEAIAPYTNSSFWSVDADADIFRDFVISYLKKTQRTNSPLFLFGESYGTPRTAILSQRLLSAGINVNGIVLQSAILNYNANCEMMGASTSCEGYLPSYAAIGNYFKLDNPVMPDLPSYMQQMRSYAATTYHPAISSWIQTQTLPTATVLNQLAGFTGMPVQAWKTNPNLDPDTYRHQVYAGYLLGRYDARVYAPNGSALTVEDDPSSTVITAAFGTMLNTYMPGTLLYSSNSSYTVLGDAIRSWNFSHGGQVVPDTLPDIALALQLNPKLKILAVGGYHDLATPFYQTELDLARLSPTSNLQIKEYNGGHMTYLDDTSRKLEKADLATFYTSAVTSQ